MQKPRYIGLKFRDDLEHHWKTLNYRESRCERLTNQHHALAHWKLTMSMSPWRHLRFGCIDLNSYTPADQIAKGSALPRMMTFNSERFLCPAILRGEAARALSC